jgi:DNA-binding LacI/PurR family transcriptional regulator
MYDPMVLGKHQAQETGNKGPTMAATLKDVALKAGVSTSAVSRTFTDGASVSVKMRRKVEKAAAELGYRPNFLARSLTTRRTKLIGLVSNNFHNPIFLEVFDLFTRGLQDRGLRPLLVNLSDETDPEQSVHMLQQYSVDGVIVASSTLPPAFSKAFRDQRIPVVNTFGRYSSSPDVHVVGIDNVEAGRMAAREIIQRGYQRIGFLGGPEAATSTQDRLKGFEEEIGTHPGIRFSHSFAEAYSFDAGRAEMQRLFEAAHAEVYFCGDDVLSIGVLSAIKDFGLSVPDDIGIIGFNDMEMAGWQNIALTTIRQPIRQIINSSVELMEAMLDDPDRYPEARLFPCHVVERATLRPRRPG